MRHPIVAVVALLGLVLFIGCGNGETPRSTDASLLVIRAEVSNLEDTLTQLEEENAAQKDRIESLHAAVEVLGRKSLEERPEDSSSQATADESTGEAATQEIPGEGPPEG